MTVIADPDAKDQFDDAVRRARWPKRAAANLALRLAAEWLIRETPESPDEMVERVLAKARAEWGQ